MQKKKKINDLKDRSLEISQWEEQKEKRERVKKITWVMGPIK